MALHERTGEEADYYNLTVSALHTYAVGAGQFVVHNCGTKVGYGSTDLSQEVIDARKTDVANEGAKVGMHHNYGAARLTDGTIITGRSSAGIHAEEDLIKKAGGPQNIVDLYSELEPCAAKCEAKVSGMNVTYSFDWNGGQAIQDQARADLKAAIANIFGGP